MIQPLGSRRAVAAVALAVGGLAIPARAQVDLVASHVFDVIALTLDTGDFNEDGLVDVVSAGANSFGCGWFNVRLASDPGVLRPRTDNYFASGSPRRVKVLDLDGDGHLDVAISSTEDECGFGEFKAFRGDGAGNFLQSYRIVQSAVDFAAADWNGDGFPDVAMMLRQTVEIFFGDGEGGLVRVQTLPSVGALHEFILSVDVDGDSDPDLLVGGRPVSRVLLNPGSGVFAEGPRSSFSGSAGALGDFDGDGRVDVALAGDRVQVLLGDGLGGFELGFELPGIVGNGIQAGDLDDDEDLDLIMLDGRSVVVSPGDGSGAFGSPSRYELGADPASLSVTDVHGDGLLDALFLIDGRTLVMMPGNGLGGFIAAPSHAIGTNGFVGGLATSDFDLDGHADIAATSLYPERLWVFSGDGSGSLTRVGDFGLSPSTVTQVVSAADFDGDAIPDLAINATTSVDVLIGDGLGGFSGLGPYPMPSSHPDYPNVLTVADFDGDGSIDIARCASSPLFDPTEGTLSILFGDGAGGFVPTTRTLAVSGGIALSTADFDGDSLPDLVFAGRQTLVILLGDGAGGFSEAGRLPLPGRYPVSIAAADLNGDGWTDLAVSLDVQFEPGVLSVFLGDGAGGFSSVAEVDVEFSYSLSAADIDDDGFTDLALGDGFRDSGVRALLGDALSGFTETPRFLGGANSRSVVPADLDEDGRIDFAVAGGSSPHVFVMLNRSAQASIPRRGNVNLGRGPITDVLFANGSRGLGRGRRLVVDRGAPFELRIEKPPAGGSGRYVVYQWTGHSPSRFTSRPLPFGLGTSCLATPLQPGEPIMPNEIWNNIGRQGLLGVPTQTSNPAPSVVLSLPGGLGIPGRFFFQGFLVDRGALNGRAAVTNGIFVESR